MGEKGVTLLEVHLHGDTQFGPSSVGGGGEEAKSAVEETEAREVEVEATGEDSEKASGEGPGPDVEVGIEALVVVLVLLAVALGARRLLGDGDEEAAESEPGFELTVTEE